MRGSIVLQGLHREPSRASQLRLLASIAAAVCALLLFASPNAQAQTLHYARRPDARRGAVVYVGGCVACHGADGKGAPLASTLFIRPDTWPDFSDCAGTTPEPDGNYKAVIIHGGPSRALSQIMPAFGDLLSDEQIDDVIAYLRSFCKNEHHYPMGELNLPRALVTEKAFPENEVVVSTAANASGAPSWTTDVIDERTVLDARTQLETDVPVNYADQNHGWTEGTGDITLGLKREMFSSLRTGSILSFQGGLLLPTGDRARGFGAGTAQFEPFAAFDQLFRNNTFVQTELGADLPFGTSVAPRSMFFRTAIGQALARDHMLGRLYSPMVEFLGSRSFRPGAATDWDVLPELQITISRRQHVRIGFGVREPFTDTSGRTPQGAVLCLMGSCGWKALGRLAMRPNPLHLLALAVVLVAVPAALSSQPQTASQAGTSQAVKPEVSTEAQAENARGDRLAHGTVFRTSDRCVACHNGMKTPSGEDVSLGLEWQATIMANASRDPYWQASIRRETMDHPAAKEHVQNDCATCHIPAVRMADRDRGVSTNVFAKFPLDQFPKGDRAAADGVTCSVCHQIDPAGLGTPASFSGNVQFSKPLDRYLRAEYGPFDVTVAHQTVMHSSTATYRPTRGDHIREAALCGSCHTLITEALGPDGKETGIKFPEQTPYQEWQHSAYNNTEQTCQSCHMPEVQQPVPITALYGEPRQGVHRHVFVGPNFLVEGMLQDHRKELATVATPSDLNAMIDRTTEFLKKRAAKVTVTRVPSAASALQFDVHVENLGGHKLPSAYPSRRAWLHVMVKDAAGHIVFESGKLNRDGSIAGNLNDEDPVKFEPHFAKITDPRQVEIYEDILGDAKGHVTTGLFAAVAYLKDNRVLPHGFDKATASKDIAVVGEAASDLNFNDKGSTVRYVVQPESAAGPLTITAELWFQPIGFRWAHNLEPYKASEPQRMVQYFDEASAKSAMLIASAESKQ